MALNPIAWGTALWNLARRIDELLETVRALSEGQEKLEAEVIALDRRLTELRADQDRLVTEARSAATAAASMTLSQIAMEVGGLKADVGT